MKLKRRTVATWKNHWPEHWEMACHSAEAQLVKMVKAQIGTPAILADVDGHLARRKRPSGLLRIIPEPTKPTLCTFFESYVLPTCFYDDKPRTIDSYRNALKLWRLITGDPPIEEITPQTLGLFRDALSKRRGKRPFRKAATNTVACRLKLIQTILDKAGPPARRNRDASGLIACPPWIRPPRVEIKLPRTVSPEILKLVYDATAGMDGPTCPASRPRHGGNPSWKSPTTRSYDGGRSLKCGWMKSTGAKNCLRVSGERFKSGRPMVVHLNPAAMEALRRIRTPPRIDLSAPMPHAKTFYRLSTICRTRPAFLRKNISACTLSARRRRRS